MWTRAELKSKAKENLKPSYWGLVLVSIILGFVSGGGGGGSSSGSSGDYSSLSESMNSGAIDPTFVAGLVIGLLTVIGVAFVVGVALAAFVYNPIQVGAQRYFVEATYGPKTVNDIGLVFRCFKKGTYGNVVKTMFLKDLYVFLWSLLFIIPGIIKGYEYRMIPYILAEDPDMDSAQAFRLSKEMMTGNKWDAFVLDLSFIGWYFLAVFTCGLLAVFYVNPYVYLTDAHLYEKLKHRASVNYYDPSLGGYAYGNPGAYSNNAYSSNAYSGASVQAGEIYSPSQPVEPQTPTYNDPYQLPDENSDF